MYLVLPVPTGIDFYDSLFQQRPGKPGLPARREFLANFQFKWKACSQTFIRILTLIFSWAIGTQAAPQQAQPPATNQQQTGQAPAKPDAPKPQQQETPPSSTSQTQPGQTTQESRDQSKAQGTSKDRLFFTLPNFLTLENAGQVPPLTT
jgi:cytoskeletal protein RodZ